MWITTAPLSVRQQARQQFLLAGDKGTSNCIHGKRVRIKLEQMRGENNSGAHSSLIQPSFPLSVSLFPVPLLWNMRLHLLISLHLLA